MITLINAYTLSECMEAMAEYAAAYERAGEENLIFCEDRLTLIAERTLVRKTGGTFSSSVSTFARFLTTEQKIVGKQGSVMAVGKIIVALQRQGVLRCFTSPSAVATQAKCAYETLAQFSASCVDAETLQQGALALEDGALKNKLLDLAAIYAEYERFLTQSGYLDESRYLSLLPAALQTDERVRNGNVFFLCFSSFTAQSLRAVEQAAKSAKNVVGIFCRGREELYSCEGYDAFLRVCERIGKVRCLDKGFPLDGEAEILRQSLFNAEYLANEPVPTDKIQIFSARDKTAEAEYAAVQIKKALAETDGLRYRDVAVLLPSTGAYALAVRKAFDEYAIPYFLDEKKTLKAHPLSRFLLDCFAVAAENYPPKAVQSLAGNYFFGDGDEYRNYLLKYANFRGGAKRPVKNDCAKAAFDLTKVEEGRERLLSLISHIPKKASGKAYCTAVRALLGQVNAEQGLKNLCNGLDDLSLQGYVAQIGGALEGVLAEAELLTGDSLLKAEEFALILADGLDASEISLIPLKMDAVFVGDLCDSRIEKVRVLIALGLTEDAPRAQTDSALVTDSELARMEEIRMKIDPTVGQVNARAREAAALNLCTFTDKLFLTYPLTVGEDSPAVSELFKYVQGAFCRKDNTPLLVEKQYQREEFRYLCSATLPATRKMLLDKKEFEHNRLQDVEEYSSLLSALNRLGLNTVREDEMDGQVRVENAERLFFDGGKISPTTLENYFCCPFMMFAGRGLKLQERQEAELVAVDTGNFVHAVLERSVKKIDGFSDEKEFLAETKRLAEELLSTPAFALDDGNAANGYLARRLIEESLEAAGAVYRQIKNSAFDRVTVEKNVRTDTLKGKVDRVDSNERYIRIVDYKTGSVDVKPTSYYVGKKLQMQLYMSALQGEKIPAGVFYFPTERGYGRGEGQAYKLQGFLNGDEDALRCGDKQITAEKKSDYFDASLGENRSGLVMSGEDFRDFLAYAPMVAQKACAEIRDGYLSPSPYDGTCAYCKMGGMCGFNCDVDQPRTQSGVSVSGIVGIVREEKGGGRDA